LNGDGLADPSPGAFFTDGVVTCLALGSRQGVLGTDRGVVFSGVPHTVPIGGVTGLALFAQNGQDVAVATTQDGKAHCLLGSGETQWSWNAPLGPGEKLAFPSVASLKNGDAYMVVMTDRGRGFVLKHGESNAAVFGEGRTGDALSAPALGDVDGDGFFEIVAASSGRIWAFNHNGSVCDGFPIFLGTDSVRLSAPVLGDADGDAKADIVFTTTTATVEAFGSNGEKTDGFPLPLDGPSTVPPALADLDGDGRIELAAVSETGSLAVWNLKGAADASANPWPSFLHDPRHTAWTRLEGEVLHPGEEWMPSRRVYNYPNPNTGDYTVIRYRLEEPAEVEIRIFDLSGEPVHAMTGPGAARTENEAVWNLTGVSSGLYFCRVTAKGNRGEKSVVFKIAVIR